MKFSVIFLLNFFFMSLIAYGLISFPGEISIHWLGYQVQTSVAVFAIITLALLGGLYLLIKLIRLVFGIPSFMWHRYRQAKHDAGFQVLEEALLHYLSGHETSLGKDGKYLSEYLPDTAFGPFFQGIEALHLGQLEQAARQFDMLQQHGHRFAGLFGNLQIAKARHHDREICKLTEQLLELSPDARYVHQDRLEALYRRGDFSAYLDAIALCERRELAIPNLTEMKIQGYIALAKQQIQAGQAPQARELAYKATQIQPVDPEAVLVYAQILSMMNEIPMAEQVIETTWPQAASPSLGRFYVDLGPHHDPQTRQFRANRLASFAPKCMVSQDLVRSFSWSV